MGKPCQGFGLTFKALEHFVNLGCDHRIAADELDRYLAL